MPKKVSRLEWILFAIIIVGIPSRLGYWDVAVGAIAALASIRLNRAL